MEKKDLRKQTQQFLKQLDAATYEGWSQQIHQRFLESEAVQRAAIIGLTVSAFPEVETRTLIQTLWSMGKKVAVPRCKPETHEMDFYIFSDFEELETVYMALLEPVPSRTQYVTPRDIDLLVVPGVVFDKAGYRIGYGGGYYDRYLPQYKGETVAFCFAAQMVAKVPKDTYDYPIDSILTELEWIHCKQVRKEETHG